MLPLQDDIFNDPTNGFMVSFVDNNDNKRASGYKEES